MPSKAERDATNKYVLEQARLKSTIDLATAVIASLAKEGKTNTPQYKQFVKDLADAKAAKEKSKINFETTINKEKIKGLQVDLDIAVGTQDSKKIKEIADKIKALGGVPKDSQGNIVPGYEPGPKPKDSDGDGIPDNIDATPTIATPKPGDKPTPTPTPTPTPGGNKGGSSGGGDNKPPVMTDAEQRLAGLDVAGTDFSLPETIFNNVPSLKKILDRYVKEDWTPAKLRKEIRDDLWFRKNSKEIKERYIQLYNYEDLVKTGQVDPNKPGNTQYEKDIATLERQIADKARAMGSDIASDPDKIKLVAKNMYLTNQSIDDPMTVDFIAAAIRPIGSMIAGQPTSGYTGQALKDYQAIQGIAKANGFRVKDIIPGAQTEEQVLQGIATGRLDANRIAQDARKLAAQGQPEYVRDLLGQGYNLDQVYAPYRQTMASILEIDDPNTIDLNDSTLRSAITDKGDMNIYDFKKTLKRDSRWQYTENAKQEVSDVALQVLRDFGFQG